MTTKFKRELGSRKESKKNKSVHKVIKEEIIRFLTSKMFSTVMLCTCCIGKDSTNRLTFLSVWHRTGLLSSRSNKVLPALSNPFSEIKHRIQNCASLRIPQSHVLKNSISKNEKLDFSLHFGHLQTFTQQKIQVPGITIHKYMTKELRRLQKSVGGNQKKEKRYRKPSSIKRPIIYVLLHHS